MKRVSWDYGFLAILTAGVILFTILNASEFWYLAIISLGLFIGILYGIRTWRDRAFYLVCASGPLVLSTGSMNLWAGMFVIWMVAGIVCNNLGILELPEEIRLFVLFCGVTVPVTALVRLSNHVVLPFLLICTIIGITVGVQAIRDYTFRKQYRGDHQ